MGYKTDRRRRGLRGAARPIAVGLVAVTALASSSAIGATAALADTQTPGEGVESAAHGHGIWLQGLGIDVAGTASSYSEFPDNAGPNSDPLNLSVLQGLTVQAGSISLPLLTDGTAPGLLNLGDLGALSSYSSSPSDTSSVASSGIITSDGALDLGPINNPGSFSSAQLDASGLLRQVISDEIANELLDEATLSIGALASRVEADGGSVDSEYALSGIGLDVHSPAVGTLVGGIDDIAAAVIDPIEALLEDGGGISDIVQGLVTTIDGLPLVDASLNNLGLDTTSLTSGVRAALLQTPLENAEGSVSIDLSTGTISVNLDELLVDSSGATSLSTLAPNTSALDGAMATAILDGVSDALIGTGENSLVTKAVDLITQGLYGVGLTVDIQAAIALPIVGPLVNAPVTITGTLGGFIGQPGYSAPVVDTSRINVAGIPVGTVLQPIVNALNGAVTSIGGLLSPAITTAINGLQPALVALVGPVASALLDDALAPVLNGLLAVTINEQPTVLPTPQPSDFGDEGFTVRALSVTLLPLLGAGAVKLELGSSTALAAEAEASLSASPNPVAPGGTVTLTGGGFAAGEDVTITLPDGSTTVVPAGEDGSFTATWAVPEDAEDGELVFSATGETSGLTATATTQVAADGDADVNANASASASASADAAADNDATASAQAAAQAAANADNSSDASAASDATANAAASAAATADASSEASAETNAAASAAATASADSTADAASNADASASASAAANADASAAADAASEAAAEATSSADASSGASADATADADSDADGTQLTISNPADRTVTEGENAQFSITVTSGTPTSVVWEEFTPVEQPAPRSSGIVAFAANAWSPAEGVVSDDGLTFTVESAALSQSGTLYRATATDGTTTVTSDPAELTVQVSAAVDADADSNGTSGAGGTSSANGSASAGASSSASGSSSGSGSGGAKTGVIATTGGSDLAPLGIATVVLLLVGAACVALERKRAHQMK